MEQGATYLPGCSLKYDSFIPCMWQAVQTGHVTHADALACGEGLRYGFTCGVDISKLQGYLTFENYQSAIGAGEAVVKGINKRIEAGKTIVLGAWGDALDATLRETYSAFRVGPMGAVEKSEFEPNEKRMTNDHTRTGLNDATTLDSTLSFSLDAYDEIAHFFQTGKFMRVSDVEAAFLLIPLHPDLWPFFMHKFKASAGDAVERLCMNVFGDFGARGMPGTFHLLFTRVICGMARSQKVLTMPLITYVDDCSLIGDDRALVDAEMEAFHRFCATVCGVFFKVAKDRVAAELQLVIGFWWDSNTLTRTLEERKVLSYLATLADYAARPTLNLKEMQQVAGRMGRCVATFPPGARCLPCVVFALMVGLRLPWHRRRVSKAARDAFKYTRMLLLMVQGRGYYSYNNFPVAPGVRSDASRSREYTGGGFLSQCGRALYWRYGPHAARKPIDYLEGDTGVKMAEEMAEPWAGHLVPWECDNMVFERSAAKGRSRVERLNQLVTDLFVLQLKGNYVLWPKWLSTHDNVDADNLSRGKIADFWATVYTNGFLPSGVKVRMLDGADHVRTLPEKRGVITAALIKEVAASRATAPAPVVVPKSVSTLSRTAREFKPRARPPPTAPSPPEPQMVRVVPTVEEDRVTFGEWANAPAPEDVDGGGAAKLVAAMLGHSTEDASYSKAMYKAYCGILAIDLSLHWTPVAGYFASKPPPTVAAVLEPPKKSVRFDASVVGGEPKPRPSRPTSAQSTPPPTPAKGCGAKGRGGGRGKGVGVRGRGTFMLFLALFGGFCINQGESAPTRTSTLVKCTVLTALFTSPISAALTEQQASVPYEYASIWDGLPTETEATVESLLAARYSPSSWRTINGGMAQWRATANRFGWPTLIRRNDPDRGGKLAQFVADMLLNTALVSGTIVGYVWGMCKWQQMHRQPDPRNGVEGWRGFMDAVTIMAWVPNEPRKRLPVAVVEKIIDYTLEHHSDDFEWVQFVFLLLTLLFSFSRSECPCPKSHQGVEAFDKNKHWTWADFVVALYSDGKGGRLRALDVRMKGIKQDPRMERPEARGEGGDWLTIGDIPDSKFSILAWYRRVVAFHGRAPADLETACFVDKVGGRPLTYSQALSMFKKVQEEVGTALGDEALAAAPYGLHGARVEGWNATRATLGGDLATAHGGWKSSAKTRYDRFSMARVCRIPSAIVGQLDEHEGDRELEREMRDAGVDLEAEAEGPGPARAPAVHAPTERVDRDGLRREAGVAAPTPVRRSPARRRQPAPSARKSPALPPGWRAETRGAAETEHVVYHGPHGQLSASRHGMALALEEEGAPLASVEAAVMGTPSSSGSSNHRGRSARGGHGSPASGGEAGPSPLQSLAARATASVVPVEVLDLAEHTVESSRPSSRKAPTQRHRS